MKRVDEKLTETITNICDWLNAQLKNGCMDEEILPKMTAALAELVNARANMY